MSVGSRNPGQRASTLLRGKASGALRRPPVSLRPAACLLAVAALFGAFDASALTLVPAGSDWRFLDDSSAPRFAWVDPSFDDGAWASGAAPLGYGDPGLTPVSFGPDPMNKFTTTYFRHAFTVSDPATIARLEVRLRRDDGAVVYLNGAEVQRENLPPGLVTRETLATATTGAEETQFFAHAVDPRLLLPGTNVLAVEVHQHRGDSSDLAFDLELVASSVGTGQPRVTRGPYLQRATPSSVVVRWRTDVDTGSRVRWGTDPDSLLDSVSDATPTTEHKLTITGLTDATRYFYAVGTGALDLAGGDEITFFDTPPLAGVESPTRIWVVGDSGSCGPPWPACPRARAVRNAHLSRSGGEKVDFLLMLGDSAYVSGTDAEFQRALFDTYPSILRRLPVWPAVGNHEGLSADAATLSGPYYDIFSLPRTGQAGGVASMTEAYYSFDHANIHFIVLNSFDSPRNPPSAMLDWLAADLMATTADWLVALWHHPPYSKGSHDSDAPNAPIDLELAEMRANVLPILDDYGVDLVLGGHSHTYERSILLDSHYGTSDTLAAAHELDAGTGIPGNFYLKPSYLPGRAAHEGAVYAVVGSSGLVGGRVGLHPAMVVTFDRMGSMLLEVDGNELSGAFLDEERVLRDRFTLVKGCRGDIASGDADGDGTCDDLDCAAGDAARSVDVLVLEEATLGEVVAVEEEFRACDSVMAGRDFVVGASAGVRLVAPGVVGLGNGVSVVEGGELELAIEP